MMRKLAAAVFVELFWLFVAGLVLLGQAIAMVIGTLAEVTMMLAGRVYLNLANLEPRARGRVRGSKADVRHYADIIQINRKIRGVKKALYRAEERFLG